MAKFNKLEFFNPKYKDVFEDSFIKFLELVEEELNLRNFPYIKYRCENPPTHPLFIDKGDVRIKTPNRIAEEIYAILNNFENWKKDESGIIIWLYSVDNIKLFDVILTLKNDDSTPRIYCSNGQDKHGRSSQWFWTYPLFYDYCFPWF